MDITETNGKLRYVQNKQSLVMQELNKTKITKEFKMILEHN